MIFSLLVMILNYLVWELLFSRKELQHERMLFILFFTDTAYENKHIQYNINTRARSSIYYVPSRMCMRHIMLPLSVCMYYVHHTLVKLLVQVHILQSTHGIVVMILHMWNHLGMKLIDNIYLLQRCNADKINYLVHFCNLKDIINQNETPNQ